MKNKTDRIAGNAERNPDYVYEENPPEVDEMQCPEAEFFSCKEWMNRTELLKHYLEVHPIYIATDADAVDVIFEQERTRRYGR